MNTVLAAIALFALMPTPRQEVPQIIPEAKERIAQMVEAHRTAQTLSATLDIAETVGARRKNVSLQFAFERPNKVNAVGVDTRTRVQLRAISDGTGYYYASSADKKTYQKKEGVPNSDILKEAFEQTALHAGTGLWSILFTDEKALEVAVPGTGVRSLQIVTPETVQGEECDIIVMKGDAPGGGYTVTYAIAKKDNLLRRLTLVAKTRTTSYVVTETLRGIELNTPIPAAKFVFSKPKDLHQKFVVEAPVTPPPPPKPTFPVVKHATGVSYQTIKSGEGAEAKQGNTLYVHYIAMLSGGRKFDSSRDRKEPFVFQLGAKQVIRGLEIGVTGMKPGERRTITVPPSQGYGKSGIPGAIPPSSTLVFDVELLSIR